MSENMDLKLINESVKKYSDEYLVNKTNLEGLMSCKTTVKVGNKKTEGSCHFSEIPQFFLDLMAENNRLLLLRQDTVISELREEYENRLSEKDKKIADLQKEVREKAYELDALGQYGRLDNLKIEGVEVQQGENTDAIVKELGRVLDVEIKSEDISTSHRIGGNSNEQQPDTSNLPVGTITRKRKTPSIIVRFTRRELKIKLFEARRQLQSNINTPAKFKNVRIYEDVTPMRSRIMYELRTRDSRQMFKYVWSRGGRIYCLKPEDVVPRGHTGQRTKPTVINTPEDLKKVGFSDQEIEDIILMRKR